MEQNRDSQSGPPHPAKHDLVGATQILPTSVSGPQSHAEPAAGPPTIAPSQSWPASSRENASPPLGSRNGAGLHGAAEVQPATIEDFLEVLFASGLCDEPHFEAWRQTRPPGTLLDCPTLSAALVQDQVLTPYQTSVLLRGQFRGLVLGRYEILAPLGEGGMGAVYRARHRRMRREVAVKVLSGAAMRSEEAMQRFHREVQAAAKLHHPNIAAAYDADEEDGVHFLVMELVEGPDLASYVAEAGELPAPVAVQLTTQAARGLAHAHLQGVVHRDIKPANLVVNVQGTLKILDMGLAQLKTLSGDSHLKLTQMGQAMGTIDYMAPEQAMDAHSVDHRADIYSLGCTLFYLLTSRPMSPDGSIVQKLMWHQNAPRPSLCEVCRDATPRLNMIFQRMVAIKPDDRYELMRDVVEDLERVLPELRLGEGELPLIGDDLALYIGMEASPHLTPPPSAGEEPPLHATLLPEKASALVAEANAPSSTALIEQQLAAAAIMIGKEVSAETIDGQVIRGVVNRLSIEPSSDARRRSVRLHIGAASFGLHEIREVFYGSGPSAS